MNFLLTRQPPDGNSVRGVLKLHMGSDPACSFSPEGSKLPAMQTLENLNYLIPPGTYKVIVTYSPRFKKMLPLVTDVPGRSGIRFHRGSLPEHSRGCILLRTTAEVNHLTDLIRNEPSTLTIL